MMRNFLVLLKKEWKENMRNGKWIWLPAAMIAIGIAQPLSSYYMSDILDAAGNLPEGTIIEMPTPTGPEVLASTLSQYGTVGTVLFILASMGLISIERMNGSLTMVMVRGVNAWEYLGSKFAAQLVILFVSLSAGYLLTAYYTNLLFEPASWDLIISSLLIYSLWLFLVAAVCILAGTLLRGQGAVAGASLLFLAAFSLITTLFPEQMEWSPVNLRGEASIVLQGGEPGDGLGMVTFATLAASLLFLLLAKVSFSKFVRHR